jgi:hypothetical protein
VLAVRHVLASDDGAAAWATIAAAASPSSPSSACSPAASSPLATGENGAGRGEGAPLRRPFGVHVWVAGKKGTVCAWEGPGGIRDMAAQIPAASVAEFPKAVRRFAQLLVSWSGAP